MTIRLPRELRLAMIVSALMLAIAILGGFSSNIVSFATVGPPLFVELTAFFFQTQDAVWLAAIALLLGLLAVASLPILRSKAAASLSQSPRAAMIGLMIVCVFVLACGVMGTHIVFDGYHLSRDEFLAEFDAIIFRSGQAIAHINAEWQPFAGALAPRFMLPVADGAGFVSGYLPVNAAMRAIVGLVADSSWTSPLLAAGAVIATFAVARRLWPERPDAAFVSALLVATSPQVLITSMTSYAMTGHLALNMIWLWFFLRNDRLGHGSAIATGFFATGLHQLIFHPLFAAAFIARLWLSGRRPLALVYILSYAAICVFWIAYWKIVLTWQGIPPQIAEDAGPLYFIAKALVLLADFQWSGADLMLKNILRFISWQSPALLPLSFLSYQAIRRDVGISRELIAGVCLTVIAVFILLPYQGHGWGFRYIHGLIGSVALLGGYGWMALVKRTTADEFSASRTMLAISSAFALFVLLPVHAKQAHDFAAPYIRASKAIEQASTDLVLVDYSRLNFAEDLVRNDPFLRNRPKVLDITNLSASNIDELCSHYSIALFEYSQALALGIAPNDESTKVGDQARANARAAMARRACGLVPVIPLKQDAR